MSKARNLSDFISEAAIDATEIGPNAVTTDKVADQAVTPAKLHNSLDLSGKTVTLPTDGISGNSIHGGVISNFASTGIDDNASGTAVTILSSGNVGIGIDNPLAPLHVFSEEIGNGSNKGIRISNNSGSQHYSIRTGLTGINNHTLSFHDDTAGTDRIVISNGGNVGIGYTSPNEKLHVNGHIEASSGFKLASHPVLGYTGFDGGYATRLGSTGTSTLNATQIFAGGSVQATFKGGKVGIGTTEPRTNLAIKVSSAGSPVEALNLHNPSTANGSGTQITFSGFTAESTYPTWRYGGISGVYDTTSSGLNAGGWAGQLRFFVNRGGAAAQFENVMTLTGGANVGIGTSSPGEKLHIDSNNNTRLRISTTNTGAVPEIQLYNAVKEWKIGVETSTDSGGGAYSGAGPSYFHIRNATDNNPAMSFQTDGAAYFHKGTLLWNDRQDIGRVDQGNTGSYYIAYGIQKFSFAIPSDNVWYDVITNFRETSGYFWATVSDASSRRRKVYTYNRTSPAYGVSTFDLVHDHGGGWNTGNFNFQVVNDGSSSFRLQCQRSSYYSSSNISDGRITFLVF